MSNSPLSWLLTLPLLLTLTEASAQPAAKQPVVKKNTGGITMQPVSGLGQEGVGPKLSGGRPARTRDWPASFYSDSAGSRCTATLIGPQALILAAHCVGDQQTATITVNSRPVSGVCTHALEYSNDDSADYALCYMKTAITGIKFETINRDPNRLKKGLWLLLAGFGCTEPPNPGESEPSGGNDGVFRIGDVPINALPGERPNEPNTIMTWGNPDQAMICPGDSGGGAYLFLTAEKRLYVSVNSRVCYWKADGCEQDRMSYLSSLSTPGGVKFLNDWVRKKEVVEQGRPERQVTKQICGWNFQGPTCR